MTMPTYASLFSGGGFADIGAIQSGLTPIWAVEYDNAIADVYRMNIGHHCMTADVCEVDYSSLQVPTWLHMSPVCTRASVANSDATENELDITTAQACARAIAQRPPYISLENVWGYRLFQSFSIICKALVGNGYTFNFWHLNSADYGVPQTRKRLILIASRVKAVSKPIPTHTELPEPSMWFDSLPKWAGWYEAIKDLIPTFPISEFRLRQLRRLITMYSETQRKTFIVDCQNTNPQGVNDIDRRLSIRYHNEPCFTLVASKHIASYKAQLDDCIVQMTPRALARFQGVPDTYQLPEKNSLACKIIGNGCPPAFIHHAMLANTPL